MTKQLILASKSPRRRELMALCGYPFRVEAAEIDEAQIMQEYRQAHGETPQFDKSEQSETYYEHLVEALALAKARAIQPSSPSIILGSDTVVVLEGEVLGKPVDPADALRMLRKLAGKTHQVVTGVAICEGEHAETFAVTSEVTFYPLDSYMECLIDRYVKSGSPLDKAGGYGIQDEGALLVKAIHGDFYTVVGLPVAEVSRRLAKHRRTLNLKFCGEVSVPRRWDVGAAAVGCRCRVTRRGRDRIREYHQEDLLWPAKRARKISLQCRRM